LGNLVAGPQQAGLQLRIGESGVVRRVMLGCACGGSNIAQLSAKTGELRCDLR
jgi:hypothetical protein